MRAGALGWRHLGWRDVPQHERLRSARAQLDAARDPIGDITADLQPAEINAGVQHRQTIAERG